jgi:ABC-type lipoprotein release transport system permease subunit
MGPRLRPMSVFGLAWRSLVRQPERTALGILGVAAVGALLFDMLLLSNGLVLSMRDLLERFGADVRVTATPAAPLTGPPIRDAGEAVAAMAKLPEIGSVSAMRVARAEAGDRLGQTHALVFVGADPNGRPPWTVLDGRDLDAGGDLPPLVVNQNFGTALNVRPGASVRIRGLCASGTAAPMMIFRIAGIADFPFDDASQLTAAAHLAHFERACAEEGRDEADLLLVASRSGHGPQAAAEAIRRLRPDLHAVTNEQLLARYQQVDFSYFRQISSVLGSITFFFGVLLITVLLTVSVNQRLGEIAALRAIGFSRRRVVLDVLCESGLMVGAGGLLALPLGIALSWWLDSILRTMPGIPVHLHFFVFEPRVLALHLALVALTALLAALYPLGLVARLPIATTLRNEVVS